MRRDYKEILCRTELILVSWILDAGIFRCHH